MLPRPLPPDAVHALRQAVLRPHQTIGEMAWEGDDDPRAGHFGLEADGELVAVASVLPAPHPDDPRAGDWRVRGMATAAAARGQGAGAAMLRACLEHARGQGGERVWCNARAAVVGFYEREGFAAEGELFDVPGIGPHVVMSRPL